MPQEKLEKPVEIKIELPTNAYFMSGIRDFTLAMIKNMTDFSEQWAFRFQSVVDELCNNAIEHGSSDEDIIYITFITHPSQAIEILVEDNGTGKHKLTAKQIGAAMKQNQGADIKTMGLRGRGLAFIVEQWTDELEFSDRDGGGIKVRVKKFLNDPKFQEVTESNDPTKIILNV